MTICHHAAVRNSYGILKPIAAEFILSQKLTEAARLSRGAFGAQRQSKSALKQPLILSHSKQGH
jgi:hypothetical protein